MKTRIGARALKPAWLLGIHAAAVVALGAWSATAADGKFTAHEWGTFTSVQGADGALLDWNPLQTSQLPGFVYNWQHPGLGRKPGAPLGTGLKVVLITKQRMETPVIYFYSDKKRMVDVEVKFPKGFITEWYPQALEVGPSSSASLYAGVASDPVPFSCSPVASPAFPEIKDSLIHWHDIAVLPPQSSGEMERALPLDNSGSHYFSARQTDAAFLRFDSAATEEAGPQTEKFLFYRGVGNFATPLRVTVSSGPSDTMTVENTGAEPMTHLFLLQVKDKQGGFMKLPALLPGEKKEVTWIGATKSRGNPAPLPEFARNLGNALTNALVADGLYPREAAAMVKTWEDSWLAEPGARVLYLLPKKWTDETLPIKISPQPEELTRVMVGRAEILTPQTEAQLLTLVLRAKEGGESLNQLRGMLGELGRFAGPALGRAVGVAQPTPDQTQKIYALLAPQP